MDTVQATLAILSTVSCSDGGAVLDLAEAPLSEQQVQSLIECLLAPQQCVLLSSLNMSGSQVCARHAFQGVRQIAALLRLIGW